MSKVKSRPFSTDFKKQLKVLGNGFVINRNLLNECINDNLDDLGRVSSILHEDYIWIKFADEDVKYSDIKIRE